MKIYHRRLMLIAVVATLCMALLLTTKFFDNNRKDRIGVGIRSSVDINKVYDADGLNFTWLVSNESKHDVYFEEDAIAYITINGEYFNMDTEAIVLEPGEEYSLDILIPYPIANKERNDNVTISATTENGTKGTVKKQFIHPSIQIPKY